ncbi:hypothetical protein QJQ45_008511 [Haematococcus lacustris]|nr:hypothetical protein QJQ45_008511 [Haematococcus lacustris]
MSDAVEQMDAPSVAMDEAEAGPTEAAVAEAPQDQPQPAVASAEALPDATEPASGQQPAAGNEQPEAAVDGDQAAPTADAGAAEDMQTEAPAPAAPTDAPSAEAAASVEEPEPVAAPNPLLDKYNECWKGAQEDPNNFTAWTNLVSAAEKLDDLERLRAVYEPFLAAYPLCYGYWKKYADAEDRHGNVDGALQVFERGTAATPYSMDLWGHFANYKKNHGGVPDDVRGIYERALAYCGSDYVAHSLWDKYIHYEEEQGSAQHVASLYSRALNHPLRELPRYFTSLQAFLQGRSPAEVMSQEEADAIQANETAAKEAAAAAAREAAAMSAEGAPDLPAAEDTSVSDDELKAAWLRMREAAMASARSVAESRRPFEEGVKRAYFHVKPLDAAQLSNWLRYLDYMEQQQDALAPTVVVYERCLVACANYPEYWERYVRWLERQGMVAEADAALQRAVLVFCKRRPEIFLFAARYDERHGRVEEARRHLTYLTTELAPRLLQAVVAAANFERRQGSLEAACAVYDKVLATEAAGTSSTEPEAGAEAKPRAPPVSKIFPFLAIQYATFLKQVCHDTERARTVLADALATAPNIRPLYEAAIHLEEQAAAPDMVARVQALYARATAEPQPTAEGQPQGNQGLSERDREELSLRAIDFMDLHGDIAAIAQADASHATQWSLPSSIAASAAAATNSAAAAADKDGSARKRAYDGPDAYEPHAKIPRPEYGAGGYGDPHAQPGPPAPAAPPYYPPAAAPAAYPPYPAAGGYPPAYGPSGGYPGYGAHAGYGGYGGYGY